MNNDTTIGQNVRRLRRAAELTQADLANNLGISYQQVQKYENGTNRIAAARIPRIASYLCCDIVDLFKGTGGGGDDQRD